MVPVNAEPRGPPCPGPSGVGADGAVVHGTVRARAFDRPARSQCPRTSVAFLQAPSTRWHPACAGPVARCVPGRAVLQQHQHAGHGRPGRIAAQTAWRQHQGALRAVRSPPPPTRVMSSRKGRWSCSMENFTSMAPRCVHRRAMDSTRAANAAPQSISHHPGQLAGPPAAGPENAHPPGPTSCVARPAPAKGPGCTICPAPPHAPARASAGAPRPCAERACAAAAWANAQRGLGLGHLRWSRLGVGRSCARALAAAPCATSTARRASSSCAGL